MHSKPTYETYEESTSAEGIDIFEIFNFIYDKHGFDCFDVYDSGSHFDKWCDFKGYGQTDPAGKSRNSSNIWFSEYQEDPEGLAKRPAYVPVFDWFEKHHLMLDSFTPAADCELNIEEELSKSPPEYIATFLKLVKKEFGNEVRFLYVFER